MRSFVKDLNIKRWKIFQVLPIDGENLEQVQDLLITQEEFSYFVERYLELENDGIQIVPESNHLMTESYLMIDPEGRFFQNTDGIYTYSESVLKEGLKFALEEIYFDYQKFLDRKGVWTA